MDVVSIVVPTLNRPAALLRAIASALAQRELDSVALEVVVVDNSPDGNARAAMTNLAAADPRLVYVSEPKPGVANARNAGVHAAKGAFIAFLDDDEEATPAWIARLVAALKASDADAAFGPIEARAEGAAPIGGFSPYFSRRLERADGADVTDLAAYLGTNNSIFRAARCLETAEPFDPALNDSGGEDSLLLKRLVLGGRRFVFAAGAEVVEWVPPRRLNWAYVRKRRFLSGQIRVFVHRMATPGRWDRVALWMAVGFAQFVCAGAAALALRPVNRERAGRAEATAYGGLGKLLWLPRFRPALYGLGLVS